MKKQGLSTVEISDNFGAKWSSSNKKVATVNKDGKVRARKVGRAVITAKVKGMKLKCAVTVRKPNTHLSRSELTVHKGFSQRLSLVDRTKSVVWSSSNNKVATVSSGGVVTGQKPGKATITAKHGGKKYRCKVAVKPVSIKYTGDKVLYTGVSNRSLALYYGQHWGWQCSVHGDRCPSLKYTTNRSNIATVSSEGIINPLSPGKATITAKAHGAVKKQTVTVRAPKLTFGFETWTERDNPVQADDPEIEVGDKVTVGVQVSAKGQGVYDSGYAKATCSSSKPDVASVAWKRSEGALVVTGKSPGVATITLNLYHATAKFKIRVIKEEELTAESLSI